MGDFDNLAAEMTRRERNHREVRERAVSRDAIAAWDESPMNLGHGDPWGEAFVAGFDLGRDSMPAPINYARIAVLQTEREYVRRELARNGYYEREHTGSTPLSRRLDELDAAIREALT